MSIDVQKEAGLDPSRVHIVTSASKDFSVNGFRQGVCISQHNRALIDSLNMQCLPTQTSTAAGNLWANWIRDTEYLEWYLKENRRRSSMAYDFVTDWLRKQQVEYVPACAGHFLLIDLTRFLKPKDGDDDSLESRRKAEAELGNALIKQRVFVAPGAQYEHAVPGWFRFTFTSERHGMKEGLRRVEKALGMPSVVEDMPMLDFEKDGKKPPKRGQLESSSERSGAPAALAVGAPRPDFSHASSSIKERQSSVSTEADEKAERVQKPSFFKRLFCMA
jgi:1-aminocyclopropane-1-carboxylate synthase 1/2/6